MKQTLIIAAAIVLSLIVGSVAIVKVGHLRRDVSVSFTQLVGELRQRLGGTTNFNDLEVDSVRTASSTNSGLSALTTITASGRTSLNGLQFGSSTLDVTGTTSTLTAAQVCSGGVVNLAATPATSTITLPHATSTVADCLTTDGKLMFLTIRNASSSSQTATIASSTGTTFQKAFNSSSTFTLVGGQSALVTFLRLTSSTMLVQFLQTF